MEFNFSVLNPNLLSSVFQTEKPTKTPESPMQTVLANRTPLTPQTWFHTLQSHDPERRYVVTEMSLYKERSAFGYQHEFVILITQPRGLHPSEGFAPVAIKVSRTIAGNTLLTRLGLWGTADDTITALGDLSTLHIEHNHLHHLTWQPQQAPTLHKISHLIGAISNRIPKYHLLNASCYVFVLAVLEAANLAFNGIGEAQQPHYLTRQTHFLWYIPVSTKKAQDIARSVIRDQLWAGEIQPEGGYQMSPRQSQDDVLDREGPVGHR